MGFVTYPLGLTIQSSYFEGENSRRGNFQKIKGIRKRTSKYIFNNPYDF